MVATVSLWAQGNGINWALYNDGGIACHVIEDLPGQITHLRLAGDDGETDLFELDEDRFAFIDMAGDNNTYARIELVELSNGDELVWSYIPFEYNAATDQFHTRHAVLFFHNSEDNYGLGANEAILGWDYYQFFQLPSSMVIPPLNQFPTNFSGEPTFLVHGWTGIYNRQSFINDPLDHGYWADSPRLMHELNSSVHPWQFYYPNDDDVEKNASRMDRALNYVKNLYNSKLSVIAHSMGGLVTYSYCSNPNTRFSAAQKLKKVLFLGAPLHGSFGSNNFYDNRSVLEPLVPGDAHSPAVRDLALASDAVYKVHHDELIPLNNGVGSDYFCFIGTRGTGYQNVLFQQGYEECRQHNDGIVAISSANLREKGVGFAALPGTHDDLKFGRDNLNALEGNDALMPALFNNFVTLGYTAFLNSLTATFEVEVVAQANTVLKPTGATFSDVLNSNFGVNYQKSLVTFEVLNCPEILLSEYYVAYDETTQNLLIIPSLSEAIFNDWQLLEGRFRTNPRTSVPRYYFRNALPGSKSISFENIQPQYVTFVPNNSYNALLSLAIDWDWSKSFLLTFDYANPPASELVTAIIQGGGTIQQGETIELVGSGGSTCQWTPTVGLDNPNSCTVQASPQITTVYTLTVSDGINSATAQTTVEVQQLCNPPLVPDAGEDVTINLGESVTLGTPGTGQYFWNPVTDLNDPSLAQPIASPAVTTTYTLTATDENGCVETDNVTVYVNNPLSGAVNDECIGSTLVTVNTICEPLVASLGNATPSATVIPNCDAPGNQDLWYSFVVPESELIALYTDSLSLNSADIGAAIYSGSCANLQLIECVANGNGFMPFDESIQLFGYAQQVLTLRFWNFGNSTNSGEFEFCLYEGSANPPNAPVVGTNGQRQIVGYEYWIDNYSNATYVAVTPTETLYLIEHFEIEGISPGLHSITFRFRDNFSSWSAPYKSLFFKRFGDSAEETSVDRIEYWFNDDVSNSLESSSSDEEIALFNESWSLPETLAPGLHKLSFRAISTSGDYSSPYSSLFYYAGNGGDGLVTHLEVMEYWFDDAIDAPHSIELGSQEVVVIDQLQEAQNLSAGLHKVTIRTKDNSGAYSSPLSALFFKRGNAGVSENTITGLRYWFNDDISSAIFLETNYLPIVEYDTPLNLDESLLIGEHSITVQFIDAAGSWSSPLKTMFTLEQLCLYDFNGDSLVNVQDLTIILSSFGCSESCGVTDTNQDGIVNMNDLLLFFIFYGSGC